MTREAQEAIALCIAIEAIDDIVNHSLLSVRESGREPGVAEVRFETRVHRDLFLIRVLDFVHERGAKDLMGSSGSCLQVLIDACTTRAFEPRGSAVGLERATRELNGWLQSEVEYKMWLPTLDLNCRFKARRIELLSVAGNLAKHNTSRLTGVVSALRRSFEAQGHQVDPALLPLALEDIAGHLHEDFFVYYGMWMAELLNNARWALHDYLHPTFRWSYVRTSDVGYEYRYPAGIESDIPRAWFWRLMNHCRTSPHVKLFRVPESFKNECIR